MPQKALATTGFSVGNTPGLGLPPAVLQALNDNFIAGGTSRRLAIPAGFGWRLNELPVDLSIQAGNLTASARCSNLIPDTVWNAPIADSVFHVDPVAGLDTNTGLGTYLDDFKSAPLKTLSAAIAKVNTLAKPAMIRVDGSSQPVFTRAQVGTTTLTQPCSISSLYGRSTISFTDAHAAGAWGIDGTYPKCYSVAETNCSGVVDLVRNITPVNPNGSICLDRYGKSRSYRADFVYFATAAALNAAPDGTFGFASEGGRTYVRRGDGIAVSDLNVRTQRGQDGNAIAFVQQNTGSHLHMQGFDFESGFRAVGGARNIWLDRCKATHAGQRLALNGFSGQGVQGTMAFTQCEAFGNGADGFNPHGIDREMQFYLQDCIGWDNGRQGALSCNGLTSHESIPVFDVNGDYQANHGGNVRFINNSRGLMVGTRALGDYGDLMLGGGFAPTAFASETNCVMYLLGVEAEGGRALFCGSGARMLTWDIQRVDGTVGGAGTFHAYAA
jgi:hypothetical protein